MIISIRRFGLRRHPSAGCCCRPSLRHGHVPEKLETLAYACCTHGYTAYTLRIRSVPENRKEVWTSERALGGSLFDFIHYGAHACIARCGITPHRTTNLSIVADRKLFISSRSSRPFSQGTGVAWCGFGVAERMGQESRRLMNTRMARTHTLHVHTVPACVRACGALSGFRMLFFR